MDANLLQRPDRGAADTIDLIRGGPLALCLLAPTRIVGEAFGRALALAGWPVDVAEPGAVALDGWWSGRRAVIAFAAVLEHVPAAIRSGQAGQPELVIIDDGSLLPGSSYASLAVSMEAQASMVALLRALGARSQSARVGRALTIRHLDILQLVASGLTTEQVGVRLGIAPKTVNNHLSTVYRRLKAKNLTQAVLIAMRAGLVDFAADDVS